MGTRERLASLYAAQGTAATRFAYLLIGDRHDAEEIVQEAFVKVMARLRRPPEVNDLSPYLRQVILNLTRDRHRRARLERSHRPDLSSGATEVEPDDATWELLKALPSRQRAALVLRYYEDLSESEKDAAAALRISVSALKSLVNRGLSTIRVQMEASPP